MSRNHKVKKRQGWMNLCFLFLLAFDEFDNTALYSLGRMLLLASLHSGLRKEESYIIKSEKKSLKLGAETTHFIQNSKHRSPMEGKEEEAPLFSIIRGTAEGSKMGQDPHTKSSNRK